MRLSSRLLAIVVFLVFAIAGCQGNPKSGDVLFSDDFSSPTNGWSELDDENFTTAYIDGAYQITVHNTYTDAWGNPGTNTFTDVRIEVEATKNAGSNNNDFGIICRYQDITRFYFGAISSDGYYGILKMSEGKYSVLGRENLIPSDLIHQGNAANNIRFDCIGPTLTLFVNGTQVDQQTDSDYMNGNVGLIAGTYDEPGTDLLFDNFFVFQP